MTRDVYKTYVEILSEELIQALGCTEPIAIAFAAAKARETLGREPDSLVARCSRDIIKNAKAVYVPGTGGLKGIAAAAIAGAVGGDSSLGMRVLEKLDDEDRAKIGSLAESSYCATEILKSEASLHLAVEARSSGGESAVVEIMHTHTNVSRIVKNGQTVFEGAFTGREDYTKALTDHSSLSVAGIFEFAQSVEIGLVEPFLTAQIERNKAIAEEGLRGGYGVNVGRALLELYGDSPWARVRAYAAAGSDARMGGCSMPVVINSGSGNQGMTTSLPLILYAESKGIARDRLLRALALSNLVTIHLKTGIGRLSAYCGAMSASAGAGAGITYLAGGGLREIADTITNTLANVSGVVCDGAKASCAAKIATGIDAAIVAHHLAMSGKAYEPGSGIVKDGIEETVSAVGRLARVGMRSTDEELLHIMLAP